MESSAQHTHTHLVIHRPSGTWLHLYIWLWPGKIWTTSKWILLYRQYSLTDDWLVHVRPVLYGLHVVGIKMLHLLLETLVVTAVTEAREMVSGSRDPARRMAFLSRSSISRTAGSSGPVTASKSTVTHCSWTSDCFPWKFPYCDSSSVEHNHMTTRYLVQNASWWHQKGRFWKAKATKQPFFCSFVCLFLYVLLLYLCSCDHLWTFWFCRASWLRKLPFLLWRSKEDTGRRWQEAHYGI